MGSSKDRPDYDWQEGLRLRLYELGSGEETSCSVPGDAGRPDAHLTVSRQGDEVVLETEGELSAFRFDAPGYELTRVRGGSLDDGGFVVVPGAGRVSLTLASSRSGPR
jgi:hypothetical protein